MAIWLFCLIAGGVLVVLAMCRPDQIAWNYLRLSGILTLALLSGAGLWVLSNQAWDFRSVPIAAGILTLLAALLSAFLIGFAPLAEKRRGVYIALTAGGGVAALAAGCAWTSALGVGQASSQVGWAGMVAGQLCSGLVMGGVTCAWLLGHAYLTATKMTIAPLRRMARILAVAVVLRFLFSVTSFGIAWTGSGPADLAAQLGNSWLILSLRVTLGLLFPMMFAYMVLDCVKLRATQSATGILYFMSLFVYVGELSSQHLLIELRWPI